MFPTEMCKPEILNAQEAAEFLRVDPDTIRMLARDGRIPARKVGKEWRFSRRALLEFIGGGIPLGKERSEG